MSGVNWDKYGHCCLCHKNMIIEQVIDGKVQIRFTPDKDETQYLLNDGSKMRVSICKSCKKGLTDKDFTGIMASVMRGWEEEVKTLKWTKKKKRDYLNRYSKLKIVKQQIEKRGVLLPL